MTWSIKYCLLNGIMNYMATRPYQEVEEAMEALKELIIQQNKEKESNKDK